MPKASMHEDDLPAACEDDIGPSGKARRVKPVAVVHPPQQGTNTTLRLRIFGADRPHYPAARLADDGRPPMLHH